MGVWAISLVASLAGLTYGMNTGMISTVLVNALEEFGSQNDWLPNDVAFMGVVGVCAGILFSSWMCDRYGRKTALQAANSTYLVGTVIMFASSSHNEIVAGRIISSIGLGVLSVAPPIYIAEICTTVIHGQQIAFNCVLIAIGHLCSALLTKEKALWRWMLVIGAAPALLQFFMLTACPETPRWLVIMGEKEEARVVVQRLNPSLSNNAVVILVDSMEESNDISTSFLSRSWNSLQSSEMRGLLFKGVAVQVLQQLLDLKTILNYLPKVLSRQNSKFSLVFTVLIPILDPIGTIIGLLLIERLGRNVLLRTSFLSSLIIGVVLYSIRYICEIWEYKCPNFIDLVSLLLYVFYILLFTPGMETVPWVINVELYPCRFRSLGGGLAAIANILSQFLVSQLPKEFWFLITIVSSLLVYYVWKHLPETCRITIENAWQLMHNEPSPQASGSSSTISRRSTSTGTSSSNSPRQHLD